ncbi:MAG: GFA family protein [Oceanospirillaceae bacterium]|nr:GFA family protein [Oceanospirillaceae bacterium]
MYKASCLCGEVKIEISGTISDIIHCHCSRCRKSTGSAYATTGYLLKTQFLIINGQSSLKYFQSTEQIRKYFCQHCASPIYSENTNDQQRIRIRLGVLDCDIIERPSSHNFVTSRACWDQFNDRLPHYKGIEPNRSKLSKE